MCVIVDETAPESLLDMVEELLEPLSPGARVVYDELCKGSHSYDDTTDFVVIVAGGNRRVGWFADAVRAEGIPVAVVAASADFVAGRAREAGNPIPEGDVLDGTDAEKLGLSDEEMAFYDAITKPQAVKDFYDNDQLVAITRELTEAMRKSATIDWQRKESARAGMRLAIKKLLRKYKYPPEGAEEAMQTVMAQCELWADTRVYE